MKIGRYRLITIRSRKAPGLIILGHLRPFQAASEYDASSKGRIVKNEK